MKYTGWLLDGTQFDSSWDKNTTLEADTYSGGNHQVIEGWQQAMVGQTVGSQVLMVIPPNLGYGSTARAPSRELHADLRGRYSGRLLTGDRDSS